MDARLAEEGLAMWSVDSSDPCPVSILPPIRAGGYSAPLGLGVACAAERLQWTGSQVFLSAGSALAFRN